MFSYCTIRLTRWRMDVTKEHDKLASCGHSKDTLGSKKSALRTAVSLLGVSLGISAGVNGSWRGRGLGRTEKSPNARHTSYEENGHSLAEPDEIHSYGLA